MSKYDSMSVADLNGVSQTLAKDKAKIRAEQRLVAAALDAKEAEVKAAEKVKAMSDGEKKAVAQAIAVEGIESEESVGTPGE
jgi:hypothetical protein